MYLLSKNCVTFFLPNSDSRFGLLLSGSIVLCDLLMLILYNFRQKPVNFIFTNKSSQIHKIGKSFQNTKQPIILALLHSFNTRRQRYIFNMAFVRWQMRSMKTKQKNRRKRRRNANIVCLSMA